MSYPLDHVPRSFFIRALDRTYPINTPEALIKAILEGNIRKVQSYLNQGTDPNKLAAKNVSQGAYPLHMALAPDHYYFEMSIPNIETQKAIVKELVLNDAKLDQLDSDEKTPLEIAQMYGRAEIYEYFKASLD